jgi:hypothetical protein
MRMILLVVLAFAGPVFAQESLPQQPPKEVTVKGTDTIILSGTAKTARIADPNERVVFSGRVMRMADFVAAVSSSTEGVQRLRNQEMHNRETGQPAPPAPRSN